MLKKLDIMKDTRNVIDKGGIVHMVANFTAIEKINEVVDAVNELQKNVTISRMEKVETRAENVQDKFAEQRKWIGKLCKFWDNNENIYYGLLTEINDINPYCYEYNHKLCYKHCELVKPDDDIIYKGE